MSQEQSAKFADSRAMPLQPCTSPLLADVSCVHVALQDREQDGRVDMYKNLAQSVSPEGRSSGTDRLRARIKMGAIFVVTLVVLHAYFCSTATIPWPGQTASSWPALRFTENGTFQIAVFEDLHFGESRDPRSPVSHMD